ncbi:MAG: AraC family transcriptional regulator, partial [Planctomycetes bacterium]|nr:AraC family transcriptional regulator [Planctomycetota bacterium]
PKPGGSFLGSSGKHIDALVEALWNLPRRSFPGDKRMGSLLSETMRICSDSEDIYLNANQIASNLAHFLLLVIQCARNKVKGALSTDIETTVRWIENHPDQHPNINELAEMAHLSVSRFKNKFVEQVGLSPGDYILRHKVEVAKSALSAGRRSITDIALELGFSSHQHFSSTFSRYIGYPPSAYAAQRQSDADAHDGDESDVGKLKPRFIGDFCHGYFAEK